MRSSGWGVSPDSPPGNSRNSPWVYQPRLSHPTAMSWAAHFCASWALVVPSGPPAAVDPSQWTWVGIPALVHIPAKLVEFRAHPQRI
jgi:hypothetical protein